MQLERAEADAEADIVGRHGPIKLHGPAGFAGMRAAGRCAAEILDALVPHVVPGVTTEEIDEIVFAEMKARGAIPATLRYRGYTKSCCTSINHVICHGIPGDKVLKDGDIVMAHLGIWSRQEPFAPALNELLSRLQAKGFCFATLAPEQRR